MISFPPTRLTGREEELSAFQILLSRADAGLPFRSPLLIGPHGSGKTVLLQKYVEMARIAGWAVVSEKIERNQAEPVLTFMEGLSRKAVNDLARDQPLLERASWIREVFATFHPGLNLSSSLGPSAEDLTDLLVDLGKTAQRKSFGVLFALDEAHELSRADFAALSSALHQVSQRALPVVVALAGLSYLGTNPESQSYADRLFDVQLIDKLDEEAAREAILEPARALDVDWTPDALSLVLEESKGLPYLLQQWGHKAWLVAEDSPITVMNVKAASELVEKASDRDFYETHLDKIAPREREYLLAMISLGDGPYESGSVAVALKSAPKAISWLRDTLIHRGLIYSPRLGQLDFTVPGCAAFLRRWQLTDNSLHGRLQKLVDRSALAPILDEDRARDSLSATATPSIFSPSATRGSSQKDLT